MALAGPDQLLVSKRMELGLGWAGDTFPDLRSPWMGEAERQGSEKRVWEGVSSPV